jgi:O-antigen/teichoic acid export membrane protein
VVASLLVALAAGSVVVREVSLRGLVGGLPSSFPYGELMSFNGYNVVLIALVMSLFHVDIMMLRLIVGGEQTGYYKAALTLAEYIWLIPTSIQTLMLHSTSNMWSRGESDCIGELAGRVTRYVFLFTGLLAIGVFTLADSFVPLYYGSEFSVIVRPLAILLPGALGFALARPLYGINKANGRLWPLTVVTIVAALGNALLNGLLIPRYGMAGAAIATSTSYASMFLFQVACGYYLGYDPLQGIRPVRTITTLAVSAPLIVGLKALIHGRLISLIVIPLAGFAIFWAVAFSVGAVDTDELDRGIAAVPLPVKL